MANKVLIINTHLTYQGWTEGTLNNSFVQKAKEHFEAKGFEILETKVENGYDATEEVEKHLQADIVILQTPINWFGAPWIYKKYVDEVFNIGLGKKLLTDDGRTRSDLSKQYGTGGHMQGKKFMISATWNAPEVAFDNSDQTLFAGKGLTDIFLPITSNYKFCGYDILDSYNCFDIFKRERDDISKDIENYPKHLEEVFGV